MNRGYQQEILNDLEKANKRIAELENEIKRKEEDYSCNCIFQVLTGCNNCTVQHTEDCWPAICIDFLVCSECGEGDKDESVCYECAETDEYRNYKIKHKLNCKNNKFRN